MVLGGGAGGGDAPVISAVDPHVYARRFIDFSRRALAPEAAWGEEEEEG